MSGNTLQTLMIVRVDIQIQEEMKECRKALIFRQTACGKFIDYNPLTQPIHGRGWTYQENLLSRRVLSFGDQMGWRCANGEDLNFGITTSNIFTKGIFSDGNSSPFNMPSLNGGFVEDQAWHRLFEPFSYLNRLIRERRAHRDSPSTDSSESKTKGDDYDSDFMHQRFCPEELDHGSRDP
jgi:hypothetical protein